MSFDGRIVLGATDYNSRRSIIVTATGGLNTPTFYFYKLTKNGATLLYQTSNCNSAVNINYKNGVFFWSKLSSPYQGQWITFDDLYNVNTSALVTITGNNANEVTLRRYTDIRTGNTGLFTCGTAISTSSSGAPYYLYNLDGTLFYTLPTSNNMDWGGYVASHHCSYFDTSQMVHIKHPGNGKGKIVYPNNTKQEWTYTMSCDNASNIFIGNDSNSSGVIMPNQIYMLNFSDWYCKPRRIWMASQGNATDFIIGTAPNEFNWTYGHVNVANDNEGYCEGNCYCINNVLTNINFNVQPVDIDEFKQKMLNLEVATVLNSNSNVAIYVGGTGASYRIGTYNVTGTDCNCFTTPLACYFVEA